MPKKQKVLVTQTAYIVREVLVKKGGCPINAACEQYDKKCDELLKAKDLLENLLEVGALGDGDAAAIRTMLGFVCEVMDSEHDWSEA